MFAHFGFYSAFPKGYENLRESARAEFRMKHLMGQCREVFFFLVTGKELQLFPPELSQWSFRPHRAFFYSSSSSSSCYLRAYNVCIFLFACIYLCATNSDGQLTIMKSETSPLLTQEQKMCVRGRRGRRGSWISSSEIKWKEGCLL